MKKVYMIMCTVTALGMLLSGAAHAVRYADVIDGYSMQLDQNGVMANHNPGFSQGANDMLIIAVGPGGGGKGPGGGGKVGPGGGGKGPGGGAAKPQPSKQPSAAGNQRDAKQDARDTRQDAKKDARDTRQDAKQGARDTRQDSRTRRAAGRDDVRDERREHHEDHHRGGHALGAVITVSAFRALTCTPSTVVVGNVTYTSCGGTWYQQKGNTYIVVEAPK